MPSDSHALSERSSAFYSQLLSVAEELNEVSDELGQCIAQIDASLKKLNLGITVWVRVDYWEADERGNHEFWEELLGYAKINGKWGVCLRRLDGNLCDPDAAAQEEWLFNDAPRLLRLAAIDRIPELIERLIAQAKLATTKIQSKLVDAQTLAAALNPLVPPLHVPRPSKLPIRLGGQK